MTFHGDATRLNDLYKVIENSIGDVFVEDTFVAKFLKIELEALQFHAELVGDIFENQRSKVGLASLGADRGKFRAMDLNRVGPTGEGVFETFELILKRCTHRVLTPLNRE